MGFGIALFGYAFLLAVEFGGAAPAALLIGWGLYRAARLNKKFFYSAVAALFMLPRGVVVLLNVIKAIDLESLAFLNAFTFLLYLAAWGISVLFWMNAVLEIAAENGALRLKTGAARHLVFTECAILFMLAVEILWLSGISIPFIAQLVIIQYVVQYAVILINIWFMHTCFICITSESNYQKELNERASERATEMERRHKEQAAEAKRYEKHRR
ncbi:MAG: hypothetical protein IKX92_06115 [Clostridia bacterium]|nr:hypothetical protein [Clostridia bacterium]